MILKGEINEAKMSSFSSDFQTLVERVPATVKCCLEASPLTSTPPLPVIAPIYLYIKKYLRLQPSTPPPLKCSEMNLIYYDVLKLNYKPVKLIQNDILIGTVIDFSTLILSPPQI